MTTMTLAKTRPAETQARQTTVARCTPPRMERRWFKVEGKLECRWVEA